MSVPNTFSAGTTISPSAVNENFTYLDGRVSSLTQDNFTAVTRIPNSILANPNTVVPLKIVVGTSGWHPTSGYVQGFVSLPYDSTEGAANYTLIAADAHWFTGVSAGDATLEWGYFQTTGTTPSAWTRITNIATFTVTSCAAGSYCGQTISGLPVTVATSSNVRAGFAVRSTTTQGAFVAGGNNLVCDLKLIRALRG